MRRLSLPALVLLSSLPTAPTRAQPSPQRPQVSDTPTPAPAPGTTPARSPDAQLPQQCGQDPFRIAYGPIARGAIVRLGRHRSVDGQTNWDPAMEHYVGRVTPVLGPRGVDPQGCALIEVSVDGGEYVWRVRDLELVAAAREPREGAPPELRFTPGGPIDPRVYEGQFGLVSRKADTLADDCAGWVTAAPTLTLVVEDEVPTLSVLVDAGVDAVLVVRTPSRRTICVDDAEARNPVLTGRAEPGRYEVYVGTFEPVRGTPTFRLGLSERATVRAADLRAVPVAAVHPLVPPDGGETRTRLQPGRPTPASPPASDDAPPADADPAPPTSNTR